MRQTANVALVLASLLGLLICTPALGRRPGEAEAKELLTRAEKLAKARQYEEAADALNKLLKLLPDNDQVLALASEMEYQAGRYADGLKHAQQALKLNPKGTPYYIVAATNAHALQDLKLAREYTEKVLAMSEADVPAVVRYKARELDEQTAPKTYVLTWNLDPRRGVVVNGATTIALPRGNLPGQAVTYEVKGVRKQQRLEMEANHMLRLVLAGLKPFKVTMKITLKPYSYKKELAKATTGPIPAAVKSYLGPCESVNPKSPTLTKIVGGLKTADRVETVRNILKWLKKNVEYKNELAGVGKVDFKKVEELVKRGHAECRGYTMLFTGLCRAAGIPARPVWGLVRIAPTAERPKGSFASHNWAEVYFPGSGWVPVDPQRPETLGWLPSNIIRIFMDVRRTVTTQEHLPMRNLVHMNGETIDFEVSP